MIIIIISTHDECPNITQKALTYSFIIPINFFIFNTQNNVKLYYFAAPDENIRDHFRNHLLLISASANEC